VWQVGAEVALLQQRIIIFLEIHLRQKLLISPVIPVILLQKNSISGSEEN
jgi:hypothetical protein